MADPTNDTLKVRVDTLRTEIATHQGGLVSARSPRARLSHQSKLSDARRELASVQRKLSK